MILRVKTDNVGNSANDSIVLPFLGTNYDVTNWGDGTQSLAVNGTASHTYSADGTYTVTVSNTHGGLDYAGSASNDKDKIVYISQFGTYDWSGNRSTSFQFCSNLIIAPTAKIYGTACTSTKFMFRGLLSQVDQIDLSLFNYSSVIDSASTFRDCTLLDQDISMLDLSSATSMQNIMNGSAFSQTNFDKFLIAIEASGNHQNGVTFDAGTAQYGAGAPATARADMIADHSWAFMDGGLAP